MATLVLAIGDVHGHWSTVISAIDSARQVTGRLPDLVLQVGDAEALRDESDLAGTHVPSKYRSMGDFALLGPGDIPVPLFFIAGNHDPYPTLDAAGPPYPLEWGTDLNVHYLGRAGATTLPGGLNVAWLSGIYSPKASAIRTTSPKARAYFVEDDIEATISAARRLGRVDVLLTHDWPAGVTQADASTGNEATRRLVEVLRPTLGLCGHHHRPHEGMMIGGTTVHCLNAVPAASGGKSRDLHGWWRLYAFDEDGRFEQIAVGGWG